MAELAHPGGPTLATSSTIADSELSGISPDLFASAFHAIDDSSTEGAPDTDTDLDLAQTIASLPEAMAASAIAAGVLDTTRHAPHPARTSHAPAHAPKATAVRRDHAPHRTTTSSASHTAAPLSSTASHTATPPATALHANATTPNTALHSHALAPAAPLSVSPSATAPAPGQHLAQPLQRTIAVQRDPPPTADTQTSGQSTASTHDTPSTEQEYDREDVERLADEVFQLLRWRLAAERERSLAWR